MKRLSRYLTLFIMFAVLLLSSCNKTETQTKIDYDLYSPILNTQNDPFDFESNAFISDITIDGIMDEDRWLEDDVITLGSFDDSDIENNEYGAIVENPSSYSSTKRAVTKMFRGNVGFHFGFTVLDSDLAYKALSDGDDAIWSDNILINLDTEIDGSNIPMSDDYYIMVTAWNNNCFRRGANAAGMWGAWSGVVDYQSKIIYEDDKQIGFVVEMVIPYKELGLKSDSPVGIALRSCNRYSSTNNVIEDVWYIKEQTPDFNTPNSYIIWGSDNNLYSYYDYKMPNVNINGSIVDYITNEPLEGVNILGTLTQSDGSFILNDIDSNNDLIIYPTGEHIVDKQSYVISKDLMRKANGGIVPVNIKLITKNNMLTKTIKGKITTPSNIDDIKIEINGVSAKINSDYTYYIECSFDNYYQTLEVSNKKDNVPIKYDIYLEDVLNGKTTYDILIPEYSKLDNNFGENKNVSTYLGWTNEGLYVRFENSIKSNGFGIAYDTGSNKNIILYHTFGTMCMTDYYNYKWNYYNPSQFNVTAEIIDSPREETIYTFIVPFETLGIDSPTDIKIAPFEYTINGPFAYYVDDNGSVLTFGSDSILTKYPVLSSNGSISYAEKETIKASYTFDAFGKGNANVRFDYIDSQTKGIKVTITYNKTQSLWGYGIIFGNKETNVGTTDLYAIGYGTMDHKVYGDWNWKGEYKLTSDLKVDSSESVDNDGNDVITLFYSFETLNNETYKLEYGSNPNKISIQLFEYVTDGTGNLFGSYNCITIDNEIVRFDTSVNDFIDFII